MFDKTTPSVYLFSLKKRALDIVFGVLGTLVFSVVALPAIVLVVITSKGGPFYTGYRVGKDGTLFKALKMRTMYLNSDKDAYRFVTKGDERVTPVGKLMRKLYIDELPQFINVLKNDMSIVGPRPEIEVLVEEQSKIAKNFKMRNLAKPGITGLAQIRMPHADDANMASKRLEHDMEYIQVACLKKDLQIILETVFRIIRRKGH